MPRLLFTCLLLLTVAAQAQQIYKTTDAEGNVIFTDQPPAGSDAVEQVELHRTNTAPPPTVRSEPPPPVLEPEEVAREVTIVEPANETTIPMGPGNFTVRAGVTPPLAEGESLQLRLDGEPQGEPQQAAVWQLTNVFRGAHDLTVSVVDADGGEGATSSAVRVYVLRPSVNFRR